MIKVIGFAITALLVCGLTTVAAQGQGKGRHGNMPTFDSFDLNGDGVLLEDEFYQARNNRIGERAKQGYRMRGLANAQPFSAIDLDGDGKVNRDEFSKAQAQHKQSEARPAEKTPRESGQSQGLSMPSFSSFDLNGDGVLLEDEFYQARNDRIGDRAKQGYMMRGLGDAQSFSAIDLNSDGKIDSTEFSQAQADHK